MSKINQELVLKALSHVMDPDLQKDLVTLNMIRDLEVNPDNGAVSVRVVLTTPACPLKAKIEQDVRDAIASVEGAGEITIKMDAEVRNKNSNPGKNSIPGVQHIIAVSSGKGGVGKSTVSVNLALSLSKLGAKVGIMDADLYGPNLPTMLGVQGAPEIVDRGGSVGEMFIPPEANGIKVMSMGMLVDQDQAMVWRGPMLHNAMTQFCRKVEWGDLDYLVIDMPPGTGDIQLSLSQLVPVTGAVLVTTPQEVALQDVRKAYSMWDRVKIPMLGIVENMSYFECDDCHKKHAIFGDGGGVLLAKRFGLHLLSKIPIVPQVREGGDIGMPITMKDPEAEVSKIFLDLAKSVAQQVSVMDRQMGSAQAGPEIGQF